MVTPRKGAYTEFSLCRCRGKPLTSFWRIIGKARYFRKYIPRVYKTMFKRKKSLMPDFSVTLSVQEERHLKKYREFLIVLFHLMTILPRIATFKAKSCQILQGCLLFGLISQGDISEVLKSKCPRMHLKLFDLGLPD